MNEPVENLEMAETKEMVSDAYRGDSQSDAGEQIAEVHRGDGSAGIPQGYTGGTVPTVQDETEWMYAEDAAPGSKNLREYVRDGAGGLTERDRATLGRFRELAASVPATIEDMLRDEKLPAMARIRLIEIIMDRAYGKAEATVNVNGNVNGIEASEMRVEALVRSLKLEGNGYEERGD